MKKLFQYFALSCLIASASCKDDDPKENVPPVAANCEAGVAAVEQIPIFPATHPLNTDISSSAVDSRSGAIISFLTDGFSGGLKADFGSGLWEGAPIGIPFVVVCDAQPKLPITFAGDDYDGNYGDESDAGPYPIPLDAPVEGNGESDSHVLAVDVENKKLYELYNAKAGTTGWTASSGAIFDLTKVEYRPAGWTSADAAGLPIFPCLLRYEEVASGTVDHAIRFTLSRAKVFKGYVEPATHFVTGSNQNTNAPTPMGMRLRLKSNFDINSFSASNKVILSAMKKYGIILADIGSNFYISGAPDERWNNDDLQQLRNVKPTDFEVVQMGAIISE
jgi:hypothetical protein